MRPSIIRPEIIRDAVGGVERVEVVGIAIQQRAGLGRLNLAAFPLDQDGQGVRARPVVSITLQSTVGGFSAEFMRTLPLLEQAMVAHGLEPSGFVISKDRATPPTLPILRPSLSHSPVFSPPDPFP